MENKLLIKFQRNAFSVILCVLYVENEKICNEQNATDKVQRELGLIYL